MSPVFGGCFSFARLRIRRFQIWRFRVARLGLGGFGSDGISLRGFGSGCFRFEARRDSVDWVRKDVYDASNSVRKPQEAERSECVKGPGHDQVVDLRTTNMELTM